MLNGKWNVTLQNNSNVVITKEGSITKISFEEDKKRYKFVGHLVDSEYQKKLETLQPQAVHKYVAHIKKQPYDIYVGRPSKWGNPFSHREGTLAEHKVETREEAVKKYEEWLLKNEELMASLGELKGKILGCWCWPLSCHAEILARLANNWASKVK